MQDLISDANNAITKDDQNVAYRTLYFQSIVMHSFFAFFLVSFVHSCNVTAYSPRDLMNLRKDEGTHSEKYIYHNIWDSPELYNIYSFERKSGGKAHKAQYRLCRKCNMWKPDRTHHGKEAGKCIVKMDHYCPWLNNTLGHNNLKYFFLTLAYGNATLISWLVLMWPRFRKCFEELESLKSDFMILFAYFLAFKLSVVLNWFFMFHCRLASSAYTTIEYCEKKRDSGKTGELYATSPYDKGLYGNIVEMLGPYPVLWLLPTYVGMRRDGDIYFVAENPEASHCDLAHPLVVAQCKKAKTTGAQKILKAQRHHKEKDRSKAA